MIVCNLDVVSMEDFSGVQRFFSPIMRYVMYVCMYYVRCQGQISQCMYVYLYVCMNKYMSIFVFYKTTYCMYVCMYVCTYVPRLASSQPVNRPSLLCSVLPCLKFSIHIHTYIHFITSFSKHGGSYVPDNDQQGFLQYIIIWAGRSGIQQPTYTDSKHIHTYIHTYIHTHCNT